MAELEIVGFDSVGKELEAPQGADTYVAKKAVRFTDILTTLGFINGRDIGADGTKLDLITVTVPTDLDALYAAIDGLSSIVTLVGEWLPSSGVFPTSTLAGESWICGDADIVDGQDFNIGDRLLAVVDGANPASYAGQWLHLDYTDQVLSVNGQTGTVVLTIGDLADAIDYLKKEEIDSLAKLNALILDATLGDATDFATAAQGVLASSALQPASIATLTLLNALVTDATLIDTTDSRLSDDRNPIAHFHGSFAATLGATGAYVLSGLDVHNGIISVIAQRELTIGDIGAAADVHTHIEPVSDTLTATPGGGQATAIQLAIGLNVLRTVASDSDSAKLPSAVAGIEVTVVNKGAAFADLFPTVDDSIGNNIVNTAVPISPNGNITLKAIDAINWIVV